MSTGVNRPIGCGQWPARWAWRRYCNITPMHLWHIADQDQASGRWTRARMFRLLWRLGWDLEDLGCALARSRDDLHRMLASWIQEPISDEDARGLDSLEAPGAVLTGRRR
jgi:hypothetical protein